MSEEEFQELEMALRAATPAPWQASHHIDHTDDGFTFCDVGSWQVRAQQPRPGSDGEQDARLIAAAVNAAPSLISEVRRLRTRVKELEESLCNIEEAMSWRRALD